MNFAVVSIKVFRAMITVFLLVLFVFVILRMSGDPAVQMLGLEVDPSALEAFRHRWGLDRPIWQQFLSFFWNFLHGDFGKSFIGGRDALGVVLERLPKTLWLMGLTTIFTFGLGIPAGIYASLHRNTIADRAMMGFTVASFSLPNFVVGIILIMVSVSCSGYCPRLAVTRFCITSCQSSQWRRRMRRSLHDFPAPRCSRFSIPRTCAPHERRG